MTDNQIIDLYWQRKENAIRETEKKYRNYCYTIAHNILQTKEDCEEILNDTYMGCWHSIPPSRPNNLATFLGKITRNLSLKRWRYLHAQKRSGDEVSLAYEELDFCIPDDKDIDKTLEAKEISKIINNFLEQINDIERKIFVCRYWYFDSISDISNQFKFSESKITSMLYRSRKKLATILRKEGVYFEN